MTSTSTPRRRQAGLGLLLVPTLAITLLGTVPNARAAQGPHGASATAHAKHRGHAVHSAGAPLVVPTGSAVVTNCSTAGFYAPAGGAQGVGLATALAAASTITFACNPALGAKVGASYVIMLPQTASPAIVIPAGEQASIDGSDGGANDVVIDGGATLTGGVPTAGTGVQIFFVNDGASLSLANLTLQHGYANDGHNANNTFSTDDGYGGAVESVGNFSATRVSFLNNYSYFEGGALELDSSASSSVTVAETITGSTFTGNMSGFDLDNDENGGAIDIDDGQNANGDPQTVTISHSTFAGNATYLNPANLARSAQGGAIFTDNGNPAVVTIDHSLFTGNSATGSGGALTNGTSRFPDQVTVTDSQFTNNTAVNAGGAIYSNAKGQFTNVTRGSFIGNSTGKFDGGAIDNDGGTDTFANSTFFGNTSGDNGGAIDTDDTSTLIADTIAGNTAKGSVPGDVPDGAVSSFGRVSIQASILSNNVNVIGAAPPVVSNCAPHGPGGTITDLGFNLEFSGAAANTCGFTMGTDVTGKDPLLGTPADNGGPDVGAPGTVTGLQTLALGAGSPAIGGVTSAAVCTNAPVSNIDNRSLSRNATARGGMCDIGAFDTGGAITNPFSVVGSFNYLGGFRLGIGASTNPAFPLGYITFQKGAGSFVVRRPVTVTCLNQCIGVTGNLIPGATVSLTLAGTISSGWGGYAPGTPVSVVLTLSTTARSPLGIAGQPSVIASVSAVTVLVNGVPVATASAPFNRMSSVWFTLF